MDAEKETADLDQLWASTIDTITLGDPIDLSSLTMSSSITSPYTVTGSAYNGPFTVNASVTTSASSRITLNGEGADIEVNGWSLVAAMKSIEERLAIMQPNPELESEWKELKQLGDQYRKLEQHIRDKQATWDRLRAMPSPDID